MDAGLTLILVIKAAFVVFLLWLTFRSAPTFIRDCYKRLSDMDFKSAVLRAKINTSFPQIVAVLGILAILLFPPRIITQEVRKNMSFFSEYSPHFDVDVLYMLGQILCICALSIALAYIFKSSGPIKRSNTKTRKR